MPGTPLGTPLGAALASKQRAVEGAVVRVGLGADQHGHVGMVDDVITDAAQDGAPYYACAAAANHDHRSTFFFHRFADGVANVVVVNQQNLGLQLKITKRVDYTTQSLWRCY